MTKRRRFIPNTRPGATGTDAACFLAATVIKDAFRRVVTWNDADAEAWLRESQRVHIFCAGLNLSHQELIAELDRRKTSEIEVKNDQTIESGSEASM